MSPSSSTVVLITGANSGIGYAAAKVITSASPSYHVIIASRSPERGATAVTELKKTAGIQGTISSVQLDVTSPTSITAAFNEVQKEFGKLDVLINNAGVYLPDTTATDRPELEATFKTNVFGPAMVTESFLPLLGKNSRVLYISSTLGSMGVTTDPSRMEYGVKCVAYRSSKAALNMIMIEDSKRLGKQGIKVFGICPGLVESNLRGTAPEAVSAGGAALSADTSGKTCLSIIEGKRDEDVGIFINEAGRIPW